MKNLSVVLIEESGEEYVREFDGMWIISPVEELQYESKYGNEIRMQGQCCAVAFTTQETYLLYTFHKNGLMDPFLREFDSVETLKEELSEEIMDIIKTRMK